VIGHTSPGQYDNSRDKKKESQGWGKNVFWKLISSGHGASPSADLNPRRATWQGMRGGGFGGAKRKFL